MRTLFFTVTVDPETVGPRMEGCALVWNMEKAGLPETIETLREFTGFYHRQAQLLERPQLPSARKRAVVRGTQVRPKLEFVE